MIKPYPPIRFYDYGDVEIVEGTVAHTFPLHVHNALCYGIITDGAAEAHRIHWHQLAGRLILTVQFVLSTVSLYFAATGF